ncbi:hypothetical protein [Undibacterium sp. RuRC25W]|uniref:hypothetical protein n=1 Tax=Undibacterium sp. RuRC25W TaxID=3413047 RepID=UPI003BEF80C5
MKDNKDNATMELPGFAEPQLDFSESRKINTPPKRNKSAKQVQLNLLEELGPTDISGLPAWVNDENTDLTGLPVWR